MKDKVYSKLATFCLVTLTSMGMLTACSSDDDYVPGSDDSQPGSEVFHPIDASTRTLRDVIVRKEYTPTEFGEAIGSWPMFATLGDGLTRMTKPAISAIVDSRTPQMDKLFEERVGTASDGSRQWTLKRCVFTYQSISGITGNDTTLIGSVVFPTNTLGKAHEVDVLTLYHHQAYFQESWLPSNSLTMMALHALHNSAVIEPDNYGADSDSENIIRQYYPGDMTALQMVDCVLAALEVMRQQNVTLAAGGYTNNWGTSLGMMSATGFAQYMENDATPDLQELFRLRATYVGEGPLMMSHYRRYADLIDDPAKQKYHEGWYPRLPYYMSCNPKDDSVDYDELKKYYAQLRTMPDGTINPNVHWLDLELKLQPVIDRFAKVINTAVGAGFVNHMLSAVATLMAISVVEDPADMEKWEKANDLNI